MSSKNQSSLIKQTKVLFVVSILFICSLWVGIYNWQKHQQNEHNLARYFSLASSLQPYLIQSYEFSDNDLIDFNVKIYAESTSNLKEVIYQKGDDVKGFIVYKQNSKKIIYIYNPIDNIYLEDLEQNHTLLLIHAIFIILLFLQSIIYFFSRKMLSPLQELINQFTKLQSGDYSKLVIESQYKEISQISSSYNNAIGHIEYLLQTREMFNKIFMHEIKTPLAKGMFYLKNEPSKKTHEQIQKVFETINTQLDSFKTLEELIAKSEALNKEVHTFQTVFEEVLSLLHVKNSDSIEIVNCENFLLEGDKKLWIICFKNIIENALRYSSNEKVSVQQEGDSLVFINEGNPLPIDITNNLTSWKLDTTQRHKSSTGYGFGLFIIQKTTNLNGYSIQYRYDQNKVKLILFKKQR